MGTEIEAPRSHFALEDIELGLRLLVLNGGDASRAARQMTEEGRSVDAGTLRNWRDRHYERYGELSQELRREVGEVVSDRAMEVAGLAHGVEESMIRAAQEKLDEVPARDLARAAYAMTQIKAENVKTARLLREQPTSIDEVRNPAEMLAELVALGVIKKS